MDENTNEFNAIENAATERRRAQDFDDLNNESAGNDVGRISRFGLEDTNSAVMVRRKKEYQSLLEYLLTSTAYREAYERTMTVLGDIENEVYNALIEASENLSLSEAELTKVLDHAQELPDGTKVFRDKDGSAFREDGAQLSDSIVTSIDWREDATTWEEYQAARKPRDHDQARFDQLFGYDAELNEIRGQMENKSNPPALEELESMQHRMAEIQRDASRSYKAEAEFKTDIPHQDKTPDLNLDSLKM